MSHVDGLELTGILDEYGGRINYFKIAVSGKVLLIFVHCINDVNILCDRGEISLKDRPEWFISHSQSHFFSIYSVYLSRPYFSQLILFLFPQ